MIQTIYPLKNGWESCCLYLVEISFHQDNFINRALFYSGRLKQNLNQKNKKDFEFIPGNDNMIIDFPSKHISKIEDVYFLKVIKKLITADKMSTDNYYWPDDYNSSLPKYYNEV